MAMIAYTPREPAKLECSICYGGQCRGGTGCPKHVFNSHPEVYGNSRDVAAEEWEALSAEDARMKIVDRACAFPEYKGMSYGDASREAERLIGYPGWFKSIQRLDCLARIMKLHILEHGDAAA